MSYKNMTNHYTQLYDLIHEVKSLRKGARAFLQSQKELFVLLLGADEVEMMECVEQLTARKILLTLQGQRRQESLALQQQKQLEQVQTNFIHLVNGIALQGKLKQLAYGSLVNNLQKAFSPPELYFTIDRARLHPDIDFQEVCARAIQSGLVIDPDRLPKELHKQTKDDPTYTNLKTYLSQAKPLRYQKNEKGIREELTHRVIIFPDGKLGVFRKIEEAVKLADDQPTKAERRKSLTRTFFNIYDGFAAIRAHKHIINQEQNKYEEYAECKKAVLNILYELKIAKDVQIVQDQIDDIIHKTQGATNRHIVTTVRDLLSKLTTHAGHNAARLEGAIYKYNTRLLGIEKIKSYLTVQTNALEEQFQEQLHTIKLVRHECEQHYKQDEKIDKGLDQKMGKYNKITRMYPMKKWRDELYKVYKSKQLSMDQKRSLHAALVCCQQCILGAYQLEDDIKNNKKILRDRLSRDYFAVLGQYTDLQQCYTLSPYIQEQIDMLSSHTKVKETLTILKNIQQYNYLPDMKKVQDALIAPQEV